jgi:hypothetical protein
MNYWKNKYDILDLPLPYPLQKEPSYTQKEAIFTKKSTIKEYFIKAYKQTREQIAAFMLSIKSRDLLYPLRYSVQFYTKGF